MKINCFAIFTLFLFLITSCDGKKSMVNPSQTVLNSFESQFGKGINAQWGTTDSAGYKAIFRHNRQAVEAYFDRNGKWLKTEREISSSELPVVVVKTIINAFKGSTIQKALQVELSGQGTFYRVTVKSGHDHSTIVFASDGVIVGNPFSE